MDRFARILNTRFFIAAGFLICCTLFFHPLKAQSWEEIDSLKNSGLPRSALELVQEKMIQAQTAQNIPEFIKAVLVQISLEASFEDQADVKIAGQLQQEMARAHAPAKQILESVLGEWMWSYWIQEQYQIRERTWVSGMDTNALETWDPKTLLWQTIRAYCSSLTPMTELQNIRVTEYKEILTSAIQNNSTMTLDSVAINHLQPTLFDFLAHRALQFFTTAQYPVAQMANGFLLNHEAFFAPSMKFVKYPLKPQGIRSMPGDGPFKPAGTDTLSLSWYTLRIFQELERFHLNNKDPQALVQVLLQRLQYMEQHGQMPNRSELYIQALETAIEEFDYSPASAEISYALARYLVDQKSWVPANQMNPENEDDGIRWNLKKALHICMEAAEKFPGSVGGKNCSLLIGEIMAPELKITIEYAVLPNHPSLFSIAHKRLAGVFIRVLRTDPEQYPQQLNRLNDEETMKYLNTLEVVQDFRLDLPLASDYRIRNLETVLPALDPGYYVLFASADPEFRNPSLPFTHQGLWATSISYVTQRNDDGGIDIALLDRKSGKPLSGIQATAFAKSYDNRTRTYITTQTGEEVSDKEGFITLKAPEQRGNYNRIFLKIEDKNQSFVTQPIYLYPPTPAGNDRTTENTRFFTDRSIYRPRQIIHFKGIILERTGDSTSLKTGKETVVKLYDANGRMVSQQKFTSDQYGSFSGSFIAPDAALLGNMRISNESGSVTFSVEEYKRPTFELLFDSLQSNYKLGEAVKVTGKAAGYAGNAIDGASFRYRVVRKSRFPFPFRHGFIPYWDSPDTEITSGNGFTDNQGSFSLLFNAIPDYAIPSEANPVFTFEIQVEVTDQQGETRSSIQNISVGYQALILDSEIPAKVNLLDPQNFRIEAKNLNGIETPTPVQLRIEKLIPPDRPLKKREWASPDTIYFAKKYFVEDFPSDPYLNEDDPDTWPLAGNVFEGEVISGEAASDGIGGSQFSLSDPGIYRIILSAHDPWGTPVQKTLIITAFNPETKKLPLPECFWYVPVKISGMPGESAQFLIGTGYKNQQIIQEIRVENKLYRREWIRLNNEQKLIAIPIEPSFRGNFSVSFVFVAENRAYQVSQLVTVPYPSKELDISLESFRKKMIPGNQETWTIRITDPEKQGIVASMLATLYDQSLDLFRPHSWQFNLYEKYFQANPFEISAGFGTTISTSQKASFRQPLILYNPYQLNWFGLYLPSGGYSPYLNQFGMGAYDKASPGRALAETEPVAAGVPDESMPPVEPLPEAETSENQNGQKEPGMMPVRSDFRETAFFYPSLLSSETGEIGFSFTVPDALTSWKFLGLAYTKNLLHGLISQEVISQKDLMVFPNTPRFVRQGDTLVLQAKIVNLSDHEISGKAMLNLSEAITLQSLNELILKNGNTTPMIHNFTISPEQTTIVSWTLVIPESPFVQRIRYEVRAQSGVFSDGEENLLPVLPSRIMVTETMPLPVPGKGTFEFNFDQLTSLTNNAHQGSADEQLNYRLTLEFASNPSWYAVMALPALDQTNHENATSLFNSLYANALGAHIANSNPMIRRVFEQWKTMNPEALLSPLQKNESVKSAILEETPWLEDARDESENRKKIGLFFDMNNLQERLNAQVAKLQELQQPSGGWPWFPGMRENLSVTMQILTGIGRMNQLMVRYNNQEDKMAEISQRGVRYLQQELIRQYQDLKEHQRFNPETYEPTATQIRLLYTLSYFIYSINPESLSSEEQYELNEAMNFFASHGYKTWLKKESMLQGMIALTAFRYGETQVARQILNSLSERALHHDELGMYWAEKAGYQWYQAPIERQVLFIEAYAEILHDQSSVDAMKTWLLKQKQTQQWPTNSATADACYALIMRGSDLLSKVPAVVIRIGDQRIDPAHDPGINREAGTGYFRMSWPGNQIKPEMGHIAITKSSEGIAWGGLYWQYFQKLDQITQYATPLKVEKQLINRKDGSYQIGDIIIVRLTITSDRDMSFVHLKDLRAAGFEPYIPSTQSPRNPLSGYRYQGGLGYYQETTDVATNFFFDYLPKGTWVLEYKLVANNAGDFSEGIATIQCYYAPEFSAHSAGSRLQISE